MKIQEYQAHTLFAEYGIPGIRGITADSTEEAIAAGAETGQPCVVKAQVLVGGRGKAGGVKVAADKEGLRDAAENILGMKIKTETVKRLLIVPAVEIAQEYYIGMTVDRSRQCIALMMSSSGGVDIEELAEHNPEKIEKLCIYPLKGIDDSKLDPLLEKVFRQQDLILQARKTIRALYSLYLEKGCSLVEINPYAKTADGRLLAIDAKINFDDNALPSHPEIEAMKSPEEYSGDEVEAKENGLSFVHMQGNIGCIVNGAGLAMATMDIIKHHGGQPANFLDVGGSSNPDKVVKALEIILRNPDVKSILINIFGGITRCDDIANGILTARERIKIPVPMVIRLIGTNDAEGREILRKRGITVKEQLGDAVREAVRAAE